MQEQEQKEPRCKFCDKKSSAGIIRLKHHWDGDHVGVEPCAKVPDEVNKESITALKMREVTKKKQNELLLEIGKGHWRVQ